MNGYHPADECKRRSFAWWVFWLFIIIGCALNFVGCSVKPTPPTAHASTGKAIVRLERANAALVRAGEAVQQAEEGIARARRISGRNEAKAVLILDTLRRRNGGKLP